MTAKTAVASPIPSASVIATVRLNRGRRANCRVAWRMKQQPESLEHRYMIVKRDRATGSGESTGSLVSDRRFGLPIV